MTDVHDLVKNVEASKHFSAFRKRFPKAYLAHAFANTRPNDASCEIGYYDKESDTITTFTTEPVSVRKPEDVFKESGTVKELAIGNLKIGLSSARERAKARIAEKYPAHPVAQEICILQHGPMWNITLVTQTLNMYNLKFDAASGNIIEEEMRNILDLRKA